MNLSTTLPLLSAVKSLYNHSAMGMPNVVCFNSHLWPEHPRPEEKSLTLVRAVSLVCE